MSISSGQSRSTGPAPDGSGVFGLALIGFGVYFGYLLVTTVLPVAWVQVVQLTEGAWQAPGPIDEFAWSNLGWNALAGFAVGLVIGGLRYVLRLKNRVVEDVVDAIGSPDVVSVSKAGLGVIWIAWHGLAGAITGILLGWLGLIQFPQLWSSELKLLPTSSGSAIRLLAANGYFGAVGGVGGGGGPPPADAWESLALVVIAVVVLVAVVICMLVLTTLLAAFGSAFVSGFAGGFFKSLGINLVLVMTRLARRSESRRPILIDGWPLDLDEEITRFVEQDKLSGRESRRVQRVQDYFQWLTARQFPVTALSALEHFSEYSLDMQERKKGWSSVLTAFERHLLERQSGAGFVDLNLEQELLAFARRGSAPQEVSRRRVIDQNLAWLRTKGLPLTVTALMDHLAEYEKTLGWPDSSVLSEFTGGLRAELNRRYPSNYSVSPYKLPENLFSPGWFGQALRQAIWIGCTTGTLNILSSVICLLIARAQLRG